MSSKSPVAQACVGILGEPSAHEALLEPMHVPGQGKDQLSGMAPCLSASSPRGVLA